MALISEEAVAFVEGVAAEAERLETRCGDGRMVWRVWGSGPPLALLHGGYGSWTHWIRNVLPLSRVFTVAAPDLPGLGESATPPEPHSAEGLARIVPRSRWTKMTRVSECTRGAAPLSKMRIVPSGCRRASCCQAKRTPRPSA